MFEENILIPKKMSAFCLNQLKVEKRRTTSSYLNRKLSNWQECNPRDAYAFKNAHNFDDNFR